MVVNASKVLEQESIIFYQISELYILQTPNLSLSFYEAIFGGYQR
jgi:hypothetical protein